MNRGQILLCTTAALIWSSIYFVDDLKKVPVLHIVADKLPTFDSIIGSAFPMTLATLFFEDYQRTLGENPARRTLLVDFPKALFTPYAIYNDHNVTRTLKNSEGYFMAISARVSCKYLAQRFNVPSLDQITCEPLGAIFEISETDRQQKDPYKEPISGESFITRMVHGCINSTYYAAAKLMEEPTSFPIRVAAVIPSKVVVMEAFSAKFVMKFGLIDALNSFVEPPLLYVQKSLVKAITGHNVQLAMGTGIKAKYGLVTTEPCSLAAKVFTGIALASTQFIAQLTKDTVVTAMYATVSKVSRGIGDETTKYLMNSYLDSNLQDMNLLGEHLDAQEL